jgi:hypothetical protein
VVWWRGGGWFFERDVKLGRGVKVVEAGAAAVIFPQGGEHVRAVRGEDALVDRVVAVVEGVAATVSTRPM